MLKCICIQTYAFQISSCGAALSELLIRLDFGVELPDALLSFPENKRWAEGSHTDRKSSKLGASLEDRGAGGFDHTGLGMGACVVSCCSFPLASCNPDVNKPTLELNLEVTGGVRWRHHAMC